MLFFLLYGATTFSMTLCLTIYIVFYRAKLPSRNLSDLEYKDAKFQFLAEYDRVNPMT